MPVDFRLDETSGVVITRFHGAITADDFLHQPQRLLSVPNLPRPLRQLIDGREIESMAFGVEEVSSVALDPRQVEAFADYEPVRVAIVAVSPVSYGLARMFQGFAEHMGLAVAVCREESEGMAFLAQD